MKIYNWNNNLVYLNENLSSVALFDAVTGNLVEVADVDDQVPAIGLDSVAAWTWTPNDLDEQGQETIQNIIRCYCEIIRKALGGTGEVDQFVETYMDMEFSDMPLPLQNAVLPVASLYIARYEQDI